MHNPLAATQTARDRDRDEMAGILSKVKRVPIFALLFTYVFVSSGLIISLLCLLLLVLWPISKNAYRRITSQLAYSVLCQMVWVTYDFAGMRIVLFGEKGTFDMFGKEHSLVTLSHRGDMDWVGGYILAASCGFLERLRTLPKKSVFYVPGFGQLLWALECVFLSRNFAKDEETIKRYCEEYKRYPFPIQICIFCEGTRFTEAKHEKALRFAREKGLKELKHHLIPRTKGFAVLAEHIKEKADFKALYDVGFAYPDYKFDTPPGFAHVMFGKPLVLYLYLRRIPMEELPSTQEELVHYCYKLYEHKDEAYEHFLQHGSFPAPRHSGSSSLMSSRVLWGLRANQLFWTIVLCSPWFYLLFTLSLAQLVTVSAIGVSVNAVLAMGLLYYARLRDTKKKSD